MNSVLLTILEKKLKKIGKKWQKFVKMAFFGNFGVSADWPKFRPNYFGRFWPKFRPKFRFRSYTTVEHTSDDIFDHRAVMWTIADPGFCICDSFFAKCEVKSTVFASFGKRRNCFAYLENVGCHHFQLSCRFLLPICYRIDVAWLAPHWNFQKNILIFSISQ